MANVDDLPNEMPSHLVNSSPPNGYLSVASRYCFPLSQDQGQTLPPSPNTSRDARRPLACSA